MLLNVSQLLETNSSRDQLSSMLTTQHAVVLPVNLLSAVLNAFALLALCRSTTVRGMVGALLVSLTAIGMLCSLAGLAIDLLYFTGAVGCSANCELTFNPGPDPAPGALVTVLRYISDVSRSAHYNHMLVSGVHQWLVFARPLQHQGCARRGSVVAIRSVTWVICVLGNLPGLVDGLAFRSDHLYYTFRVYVMPVAHTVHLVVVLCIYCRLAGIAIYQIGEVAKLERTQSRLNPASHADKRRMSQTRRNAHVIQLVILVFGNFLLTLSPATYYRAFRPHLSPTLSTVRTLLVLDSLPAIHFFINFLVIATINRSLNTVLRDYFRPACSYFCCCGVCACCFHSERENSRPNYVYSLSTKTVTESWSNGDSKRTRSRSIMSSDSSPIPDYLCCSHCSGRV